MNDDSLTNLFALLSPAETRAILDRLRMGESTVSTLAAAVGLNSHTVRVRLRELEGTGLVSSAAGPRDRHGRNSPLLYRIEGVPLALAASYLWNLTPTCNPEPMAA